MDKIQENVIFKGKTYNTECPICFEKENLVPLSCFHLIHLDCARNLISLVCPICDSTLENLPNEIKNQIEENAKKYQNDLDEEDHQRIRSEMARRRELISRMEMAVRPPPNVEILAAIQYTRSLGIPLSCIPTEIKVTVPDGGADPPSGTWFQMTVSQAMERAKMLLKRQETGDNGSSSGSDSDEDSIGDPFEEENKLLEKVQRRLDFNDSSTGR